uniref:Uncharacterized protein n=1 Tax=Tanacetum cinerariifolium TaxID=118510 RepID=A0A699GQG5_TANCI|nr:hypothetical protein [Tanacetum cinerariifolium]
MKESEVQRIKEIEKQVKEKEIQQQESLSTDGKALDASLVTKEIYDSLADKESTDDSVTSLEQLDEIGSLRNEYSKSGNGNKSSDHESISLGNDVDADIGPTYDSNTVSEVHHDMFKNMFACGIQYLEQPESILDTYVVNENNKSREKNILFRNETSSFETKIKELEMTLAQQTKDFEDAKVDVSKKTDKFETYFEKLQKTRVILERQLNQYSDLRTSYNALKEKFDSLNQDKGKSQVSDFSTPKKDRKFSKKPQTFRTPTPQKVFNSSNLISVNGDDCNATYDSDILSEVPHYNTYHETYMLNHVVQETKYFEHLVLNNDLYDELTSNNNVISYANDVAQSVPPHEQDNVMILFVIE